MLPLLELHENNIHNMKYFADVHISRLLKETGLFSKADKSH